MKELRTVKGLRQELIKRFHRGFTCSHKLLLKPQTKQLRFEKGNRNCREGREGAQRVCAAAGNGNHWLWSQAGRAVIHLIFFNETAGQTLGEEGVSPEQ